MQTSHSANASNFPFKHFCKLAKQAETTRNYQKQVSVMINRDRTASFRVAGGGGGLKGGGACLWICRLSLISRVMQIEGVIRQSQRLELGG